MTADLRALLAAATPGPWRHGPLFWEGWADDGAGGTRVFEVPHVYPDGAHQPGVFVDPEIARTREPDAALIAAAVSALPALLDALEWIATKADGFCEYCEGLPLFDPEDGSPDPCFDSIHALSAKAREALKVAA